MLLASRLLLVADLLSLVRLLTGTLPRVAGIVLAVRLVLLVGLPGLLVAPPTAGALRAAAVRRLTAVALLAGHLAGRLARLVGRHLATLTGRPLTAAGPASLALLVGPTLSVAPSVAALLGLLAVWPLLVLLALLTPLNPLALLSVLILATGALLSLLALPSLAVVVPATAPPTAVAALLAPPVRLVSGRLGSLPALPLLVVRPTVLLTLSLVRPTARVVPVTLLISVA